MGLWAAYFAEKAGINTLLLERDLLGQGGSNGLLGALMAYMPDQWDQKKQFQFEALASLEALAAELEAETGQKTGYRRSGRIMPLYSERQVKTALLREQAAAENWSLGQRSFRWSVVNKSPADGWPAGRDDVLAYVVEDFAAHVFPRSMVGVLCHFLKQARHVRVCEGTSVAGISEKSNHVNLADGGRIAFGKLIVSAGVEAFTLLQPLFAPSGKPLGRPVKGQAALLKAELDPALPVLFDDGLYVIAHEGGQVAIGSTSEDEFETELDTDEKLEALIAKAREAVPILADAPVIERWAGLRPRGVHREPMIGQITSYPDIIALGGGFKTSFGIAHVLAQHAIELACCKEEATKQLPDIFDIQIYLKRAQ